MLGMTIGYSHCGGQCAGSWNNENNHEIRILPNTIQKVNCKQFKDLNVRVDTLNLLSKIEADHTLT